MGGRQLIRDSASPAVRHTMTCDTVTSVTLKNGFMRFWFKQINVGMETVRKCFLRFLCLQTVPAQVLFEQCSRHVTAVHVVHVNFPDLAETPFGYDEFAFSHVDEFE